MGRVPTGETAVAISLGTYCEPEHETQHVGHAYQIAHGNYDRWNSTTANIEHDTALNTL